MHCDNVHVGAGVSVKTYSPIYVEIKCQLDATEVFIADLISCSTCFGAPLCPSSGAQEYYTAVAYPGILLGGVSANSVEDRGQREEGSGGGSRLVRGLEAAVILYKKFHFI